jgi:hypothetical protein
MNLDDRSPRRARASSRSARDPNVVEMKVRSTALLLLAALAIVAGAVTFLGHADFSLPLSRFPTNDDITHAGGLWLTLVGGAAGVYGWWLRKTGR